MIGAGRWGGATLRALPAFWLVLFFLTPFALIAKISLSRSALAQPPYEPVFSLGEGLSGLAQKAGELSLDAYRALVADDLYLFALLNSAKIAALSTALALVIAYPLALAIARAPRRRRAALAMLAIAPFWTSFLIRVYAWILILKDEGLLNHALTSLGLISAPLPLFASEGAAILGIAYSYLPFMVAPIYVALEAQDAALVEAAADLGSSPFRAFWRVTWPLSLRGAAAGCLLVFIPALGEFVIPDLLGGSDMLMIGRSIWSEFFSNRDWPMAAALAVALLVCVAPALWLAGRAGAAEGAR